MEIVNTPEMIEKAKAIIENNPAKTYYVDLSSSDKPTEFVYAKSQADALVQLDRAARGEEVRPRVSKAAQFLEETGPPGGPSQSVIHDLTQAAEEAQGRLKLKINRLGVHAGMVEPESLKDMATIGASLLARGVTGKNAWNREILALAAERAAEAKMSPQQSEELVRMVQASIGPLRTQSEDALQRHMLDLAPNFKRKMGELSTHFEAGKDRWDWYHHVQEAVSRIGTKEDQKTFVGFIAALSPLKKVEENVEAALKAYHRYRMINPRTQAQWDQVSEGLGIGERAIQKRLMEVDVAVRSGKDTAIEDIFITSDPMYQKVNSFYRNLWHQIERPDDVTVDSWIFRLFGVEERQRAQTYNIIREVMRQEAKKHNMKPPEFQAALWTGLHRTIKPGEYRVLGELKEIEQKHISAKSERAIREIITDRLETAVKQGLFKEEGGRLVPKKIEKKVPTLKEVIDRLLGPEGLSEGA